MSQIEIIKYDFDESVKSELTDNQKVKNLWPIVYIINDKNIKEAYVGETTDGISRMSNHLKNDKKKKLTELRLIHVSNLNSFIILHKYSYLILYLLRFPFTPSSKTITLLLFKKYFCLITLALFDELHIISIFVFF